MKNKSSERKSIYPQFCVYSLYFSFIAFSIQVKPDLKNCGKRKERKSDIMNRIKNAKNEPTYLISEIHVE